MAKKVPRRGNKGSPSHDDDPLPRSHANSAPWIEIGLRAWRDRTIEEGNTRMHAAMVPLVAAKFRADRELQAKIAGGRKGYKRNMTAQSQFQENARKVERAARSGLGKKETARKTDLNIKTVRKHWPTK